MILTAIVILVICTLCVYAAFEYMGFKISELIKNNIRVISRKDCSVKVIDNNALQALEHTYNAVPFTGAIKVGILFIGADNLIHAGIWDLGIVMTESDHTLLSAPIGKDCLVKHLVPNGKILATRFEYNEAAVVGVKKYSPIG